MRPGRANDYPGSTITAHKALMSDLSSKIPPPPDSPPPSRSLTDAARRALAEAQARRVPDPARPAEINGRVGPDPVRFGDWEIKGLATDF